MALKKKTYHKIIKLNKDTIVEFYYAEYSAIMVTPSGISTTRSFQYETKVFSTKKQEQLKVSLDKLLPPSYFYGQGDFKVNITIALNDSNVKKGSEIILSGKKQSHLKITDKNRKSAFLHLKNKKNDIEISVNQDKAFNHISFHQVKANALKSMLLQSKK